MNATEVVRQFVVLGGQCVDLLRDQFVGIERQSIFSSATLTPRDGASPVKSGRLALIGRFELHGRGCMFELDTGEELDIDWDYNGRAVFDSWRLRVFAESIGEKTLSQESLRRAAAASPSTIQLDDDQFTWATSKHDIQH